MIVELIVVLVAEVAAVVVVSGKSTIITTLKMQGTEARQMDEPYIYTFLFKAHV